MPNELKKWYRDMAILIAGIAILLMICAEIILG